MSLQERIIGCSISDSERFLNVKSGGNVIENLRAFQMERIFYSQTGLWQTEEKMFGDPSAFYPYLQDHVGESTTEENLLNMSFFIIL